MRAIKNQINLLVEMKQLLDEVNHGEILSVKLKRLDLLIAEKDKEIDKQKSFRLKLYEALSDGLIERDEYDLMRTRATAAIEAAETVIQKLEDERTEIISKSTTNLTWLEQFAKYQSVAKLTREVAAAFIDKITVFEDKTVHIDFNYRDEIASYQEILKNISQEVG